MEVDEHTPLRLDWSIGVNVQVAGLVHALSRGGRQLFYATAHVGVIYDTVRREQTLLLGHANPISAACVSRDKRWIATADVGEDSVLIVWDAKTGSPVRTFTDVPVGGIVSLDMSADGMFLVSLSNVHSAASGGDSGDDVEAGDGDERVQELHVWDWAGSHLPVVEATIDTASEVHHCVRFNSVDTREIVSHGAKDMTFWSWTEDGLLSWTPPRGLSNRRAGAMTQSVFIPFSTRVLSGTTRGELVLWDYTSGGPEARPKAATGQPLSTAGRGRDVVKVIRPTAKTAGVNILQTVDKYVVTADQAGHVRFYDFQFRVVGWFEDLQVREITSLSFTEVQPPVTASSVNTQTEFSVPDFVLASSDGLISFMDSSLMDDIDVEKRRSQPLTQGFDSTVECLAAHPKRPEFAVGTQQGDVVVWSLETMGVVGMRSFHGSNNAQSQVTAIRYNPVLDQLAVGFRSGRVRFVAPNEPGPSGADFNEAAQQPSTLPDLQSFKVLRDSVTDIVFSEDGHYMATADMDRCVALFRYTHRDNDESKPMEWALVGKHRSHSLQIAGIAFGPSPWQIEQTFADDNLSADAATSKGGDESSDALPDLSIGGVTASMRAAALDAQRILRNKREQARIREMQRMQTPRLFSVGEDKHLCEYDVFGSGVQQGLVILRRTRVDQLATPTALTCHVDPERRELSVVIANDDHKFKDWRQSLEPDLIEESDGEESDAESTGNTSRKGDGENAAGNAEGSGSESDAESQLVPPPPEKLDCFRISLIPNYGGPLSYLVPVPQVAEDGVTLGLGDYLAYTTFEKVIGLVKTPLDGNPNTSMALIAHPTEISAVDVSYDGSFLITAGGSDRTVNVWSIDLDAMEANVVLGPQGVAPFVDQLPGGAQGEFLQELTDYFVFAQLRTQGLDTTAPREITGRVPLREVVNLMRALGCYPTKHEISCLVNECRVAFAHALSEERNEHIDPADVLPEDVTVTLDDVVRLFVNYRPVFGLEKDQFKQAFQDLSGREDGRLARHRFLEYLQSTGENMSQAEIIHSFDELLGVNDDVDEHNAMPDVLDAVRFAQEVLGFVDYEDGDQAAA